jgi:hypothetical protein
MGFEGICMTLFALIIGLVVCFGGYRLFIVLLPIWAFFFGFFLGVEGLQALLGIGFLATVTSWVVGFILGAAFALLAYLFYAIAIAIIAGSLGYAIGAGFMYAIGINGDLLVFAVGLVVAVVVIFITFALNLQKYIIVVATAFGGAGIVIVSLLLGPAAVTIVRMVDNPVSSVLELSPLWTILYLVLAIVGLVVQLGSSRDYEMEPYDNRI